MSNSNLERVFLFLQRLVFQQIGSKIRTNFLKSIVDSAFILFERIGVKFENVSRIYLKMYQEILSKEIAITGISPHDLVLVIGSGSLPITPVLIAQNTQAQTIAIDKDLMAVKDATRYVHSKNLEQILKIEYADGTTYPVEPFSVIFIVYGVKHPAELLQHLASNINKNTRVIYRTITDDQGRILDRTLNLSHYFEIKKQIRTEGIGTIDSFLLMKK